jgi:predicted anti-sigma-YlaC factor YlaD
MRCKTAETWILRSLDGRLDGRSLELLKEHLEACPSCRRLEAEYRSLTGLLREAGDQAPIPDFWRRLAPRLKEERKVVPLIVWERWCLRAIPVFLTLVALAAALFVLAPHPVEMTQSEALLLQNASPITETRALFEEQKPEARNMMLIFASADENWGARRQFP